MYQVKYLMTNIKYTLTNIKNDDTLIPIKRFGGIRYERA